MIPLSNREKLIKLLNRGLDIRAACAEAKITRSNLYKYFKDFPAYRIEIDEAVKSFKEKQNAQLEKAAAEGLAKIKEIVFKRR